MERKEASFSIFIQQEDCSTRTVYYSRITSYGEAIHWHPANQK
ncbi:hypothetical protein T03_12926 [Trichinella britovi]|uniref:Uncharacterized protein n=1 Tax=Trichinella britovi TaxID=45882 RepID=A0A0V0YYD8_TRIBR|nr:hypothetical protein T03_12926 [Trichinella britovi]